MYRQHPIPVLSSCIKLLTSTANHKDDQPERQLVVAQTRSYHLVLCGSVSPRRPYIRPSPLLLLLLRLAISLLTFNLLGCSDTWFTRILPRSSCKLRVLRFDIPRRRLENKIVRQNV